ncbi:putative uncharacterized protein [Prevotella sp. CAG:924]|nr:putative uncharacterized protein [Prevotella sp. CAG:924]
MIKRLLAATVLAVLTVTSASAQLLYKISGKDLKAPSYIIGTFHLANATFVDKIAGVKDALTATDQVFGEVPFDDMLNPDSLKVMQTAMMLPDGQTLKTVLSAEQYKKLDAVLTQMMGVGLSNPQVSAQMGKMSPAALSAQLQVLMFMQKHMGEFDPLHGFDQYFQTQAKHNNEPIGGLETVAFQIALLYKSYDMQRQVEQLMCMIDNMDFYEKIVEKMAKAFYAQDIDALKAAMEEKLGNTCDATPKEWAQLNDNRNADWVRKMPAIMAAKPTFFAVGAGHLPGPKGVLQLLKDIGYTVEAVR